MCFFCVCVNAALVLRSQNVHLRVETCRVRRRGAHMPNMRLRVTNTQIMRFLLTRGEHDQFLDAARPLFQAEGTGRRGECAIQNPLVISRFWGGGPAARRDIFAARFFYAFQPICCFRATGSR